MKVLLFTHKNDKGLCSGTSLFYEYLVDNNMLNKNDITDEFVELTRLHDTWEWKNIKSFLHI